MFEAFSVGVKISLINHASLGLASLSRNFLSTEAEAKRLEARISSIQRQMKAGLLLGGLGAAGLGVFKVPLDEAKKYQVELTRFQSLGFGASTNAQADLFARGMKTIGTSARENLALVGDAMAVFKDLDHAKFAAPIMAKMKFGNEALYGAAAGDANERKFMDMLKVIEFRGGLSSHAEFSTQADFAQKVIAGSRNRVDATALLQSLKTGGVALSRRSNEAFYLGGEPLIQEFGGSRYGTAAMSIYQNLVQSRGTITAQQELYRLGLLDKSKVQFNSEGRLKKALPGSFKGSAILENEGELALLEKVLLPTFRAKGITSDEGVIRELGMIMGNRTASGLMARIYQQRATLHTQSEANRHALGINATADAAGKTLSGKEIDLHAKWRDLMLQLGNTVLPLAIRGMEILIPALRSMSDWMGRHTTLTKGLVYAFLGLSGAMAIGGTVLLVTSAFRGLGLALLFNTVGGWAGIVRIAGGIRMFGSAMAFSNVGGAPGILGIGKSLTTVAGSLGLLLQAGAAFVAWWAGQKIGAMIGAQIDQNLQRQTGDKGATLGNTLYERLNPYNTAARKREFSWKALGSWAAIGFSGHDEYNLGPDPYSTKAEREGNRNWVKSKAQQGGQAQGDVYLDGRKVGKVVSGYLTDQLSRPQSAPNGFDFSATPAPVGMNVSK